MPLQRLDDSTGLFILPALAAGDSLSLHLTTTLRAPAHLRLQVRDGQLDCEQDGKPMFSYQLTQRQAEFAAPAYYGRSGFVHPLRSPAGYRLTDDFPRGHTHQHGFFTAWTHASVDGDTLDFWNQQKEQATVAHAALLDSLSGPQLAQLRVTLDHLRLLGRDSVKVLEEEWRLRAYRQPDGFLLELQMRQQPVDEVAFVALQYHYGGFGLRGAAAWNAVDSVHFLGEPRFLTPETHDRVAANHSRPAWLALYGPVSDTDTAGLAYLGDPANLRAPQPVRVHPSMPYFSVTPSQLGDLPIASDTPFFVRYRFFLFDGPADPQRLDQLARDLAEPVRVSWLP
jgi:hypothetical protein